jgi:hypothetical protein
MIVGLIAIVTALAVRQTTVVEICILPVIRIMAA